MITVSIIEKSGLQEGWLDMLKAYAGVADSGQDVLLGILLNRAILRVQEMADKSILSCTMRVEADEAIEGVRLYQTVKDILSVKNSDAYEVAYSQEGRIIYAMEDYVTVEYTTEPNIEDVDNLLPIVFQYATALYDGQDNTVLANILKQCL